MQLTEFGLRGLKGCMNKLLDGCYLWLCGRSFVLLEALGLGGIQNAHPEEVSIDPSDESWVDIDSMQTKLIFGVCLMYFSFVLDGLFDQKGYKNISILQASILLVVFAVNLQSMLSLFPHFRLKIQY